MKTRQQVQHPTDVLFDLRPSASTVSGSGTAAHQPVKHGTPEYFDLASKIRDLVQLAREQGYVTHDDINALLSAEVTAPERLDRIVTELRKFDIEVGGPPDQEPSAGADESEPKTEVLNAVDSYLNRIGKVPLLTRDQEVQICRQIEDAEAAVRSIIYGFGFAAKEHVALAEKLIALPPQERFDRAIASRLVENRERHLKDLTHLIPEIRELDGQAGAAFAAWQRADQESERVRLLTEFKKLQQQLQAKFPTFHYRQKVVDEMAMVAENRVAESRLACEMPAE